MIKKYQKGGPKLTFSEVNRIPYAVTVADVNSSASANVKPLTPLQVYDLKRNTERRKLEAKRNEAIAIADKKTSANKILKNGTVMSSLLGKDHSGAKPSPIMIGNYNLANNPVMRVANGVVQTLARNQPSVSALNNNDSYSTRQILDAGATNVEGAYNTGNGVVDFLNPLNIGNSVIQSWASAPLEAQENNSYLPYLKAAGNTYLAAGLPGTGKLLRYAAPEMMNTVDAAKRLYSRKLSKSYNNFTTNTPLAELKNSALRTLPKAKSFKDALGTFIGIPTERSLPRLSSEELKIFRQVQDIGRMKATGKPISQQYKYALEQGIPEKHLQQIFGLSKSEIESIIPNAQEEEAFRLANPFRERISLQRSPRRTSTSDQMIDMPQQTRSDVIRHTLSDYDIDRVTNQLDPIPEEFILNTGSTGGRTLTSGQKRRMTLGESFNAKNAEVQRDVYNTIQSTKNKIAAGSQNYPYYEGPVLENVPSLSLSSSGSLKNVSNKVAGESASNIGSGDIFTGSLNTSHSSYLPQLKQVFKYGEGTPQFLGYKPMNHMGFLSQFNYSADDIAKYLNTEIDEQIKRGVIPKNISRPYSKNKPNGSYQNVILPHYGIKQFQEGGMVNDNNGYLTSNLHNFTPKKIIKSNHITTQGMAFPIKANGVPLYPNTGDYIFPTNRVVELPMFQKGGRSIIYTSDPDNLGLKKYTDSLNTFNNFPAFEKNVISYYNKIMPSFIKKDERKMYDSLRNNFLIYANDNAIKNKVNSSLLKESNKIDNRFKVINQNNEFNTRIKGYYPPTKPVQPIEFKPFDPLQSLKDTAPDYTQKLTNLKAKQTQQQTPKVIIPYGFGEPRYNNNDYNILHYKQGEEPTIVPKEYRGISDANPYIIGKYQQGGPILNNRSMLFNQMPNPTFLPLDRSRKYYLDNKRKRVSETKIGIGDERGEWVIPTTINGVQLSEKDAVDHFYQTGEHMGGPYETIDESNKSAESRTRAYNGLSALEDYKNGGIPDRYKKQGFTRVGQEKDSTRPGKKWMVLAKKGDSYKVVHGGDSSMQDYTQHHDNQRKKNFWNRMGHTSDKFSPRYWHKRLGKWEEGGIVDTYKQGGINIIHNGQPMYKTLDGRIVKRGLWSNTYLSNKK